MSPVSGIPAASDQKPSADSHNQRAKAMDYKYRDNLFQFLDIAPSIVTLGCGFCENYQKHKIITRTSLIVQCLCSNSDWKAHLEAASLPFWVPTLVQFVEIFIGKSQYYKRWRPLYKRAVTFHPTLAAWLENDLECLSDEKLWGEPQTVYTLADMEKWLKNQKHMEVKKGMGDSESEESESRESEESEVEAAKTKSKGKAKKLTKTKEKEKEKEKEKKKGAEYNDKKKKKKKGE